MRLNVAFIPILKPQFAFPVLSALADHPSAVVDGIRDSGQPDFIPDSSSNVWSVFSINTILALGPRYLFLFFHDKMLFFFSHFFFNFFLFGCVHSY